MLELLKTDLLKTERLKTEKWQSRLDGLSFVFFRIMPGD
jgi:hypothetical protein